VVVEELDPHLETHVKALGIPAQGKRSSRSSGSSTRDRPAGDHGGGERRARPRIRSPPPAEPLPGCPHRGLFFALKKLKVTVTGDIGCYPWATLPPLGAMDSCICMGASIGNAHGMEKALGRDGAGKVVAVIGDSTFLHSGVTGLMNVVYNRGSSTTILLDNDITAMTGAQQNPATGRTLHGSRPGGRTFRRFAARFGVEHVYTVNPHDMERTEEVPGREVARPEPSGDHHQGPVRPASGTSQEEAPVYEVIADLCTGCKACSRLGVPANRVGPLHPEEAVARGKKATQKGMARIRPAAVATGATSARRCASSRRSWRENHERSEGRRFPRRPSGGRGPCSPPRFCATRSSCPDST